MATVLKADKRFIGRRQELAALDEALDSLRAPRPRWIVVSGEPGIGKTRLLNELADRALARRHPVFVGRGAELESELPFAIWVDALDDHVAALGERKLEALIGDRVGELARVLPSAAAPSWNPSCRSRSGSTRSTTTSRASASASSRR